MLGKGALLPLRIASPRGAEHGGGFEVAHDALEGGDGFVVGLGSDGARLDCRQHMGHFLLHVARVVREVLLSRHVLRVGLDVGGHLHQTDATLSQCMNTLTQTLSHLGGGEGGEEGGGERGEGGGERGEGGEGI